MSNTDDKCKKCTCMDLFVHNKYIPKNIESRLMTIKPDSMNMYQFIDHLMDCYLGIHCEHRNSIMAMILPTDEHNFLRLQDARELIEDIHYGRTNDCIISACLDCLRIKRITKR